MQRDHEVCFHAPLIQQRAIPGGPGAMQFGGGRTGGLHPRFHRCQGLLRKFHPQAVRGQEFLIPQGADEPAQHLGRQVEAADDDIRFDDAVSGLFHADAQLPFIAEFDDLTEGKGYLGAPAIGKFTAAGKVFQFQTEARVGPQPGLFAPAFADAEFVGQRFQPGIGFRGARQGFTQGYCAGAGILFRASCPCNCKKQKNGAQGARKKSIHTASEKWAKT